MFGQRFGFAFSRAAYHKPYCMVNSVAKKRASLQRPSLKSPAKASLSDALLGWYDENARILPWRVGPQDRARGVAPIPYQVWLSEIMLQQTTVATVITRFAQFLEEWPRLEDLAAAPLDDVLAAWAGLGYYARARNLHKCAVVVAENYGGTFPQTEEELLTLPGVGAYTAAAIAAIAFDAPAIVVDGNIERVVSRLEKIETPLPKAKAEIKQVASKIWPASRSGDFAQSLMDLGSGVCTPRNPDCASCPISVHCHAAKAGTAERYPRKQAKKKKSTRYGACYAAFSKDGSLLVERRPEKGLLGGMLGLPGDPWTEDLSQDEGHVNAPVKAKWRRAGEATHTFTHFHLKLEVFIADGLAKRAYKNFQWRGVEDTRFPTVMAKAVKVARDAQASATLSHATLFDTA